MVYMIHFWIYMISDWVQIYYNVQGGLQDLLQSIKTQDADKVSVGLASVLDTVAELELLQVTVSHN